MDFFSAINANRKAASANRQAFGIFRVTKSGDLSKVPTVTAETREAAETKADYIRSVNPGKTFRVEAL
jgi:hypothetical protein